MGFNLCSSWRSLQCSVVLLCCISYGLCVDSSVGAAYQTEIQPQSGHSSNVQSTATSVKDASANYAAVANSPQQYRSAYYYSAHQKPHYAGGPQALNRDTYADAATDFGYNAPEGGQAQPQQSYQPSYHPPSNSYGIQDGGDGYTDFDGAGGGIGGLAGLAGLLGIKGLKGLGLLGLLKAGLLPLLFLLLPALLLIPLLIFFLPIPVITIPTPATGRSFGVSFNEIGDKMSNLARSVLDSDKCIERITCEMSRYSRGTFVDKTLKRMIFKFEQKMPTPLQRLARAYVDPAAGTACQRYGCFLMDDASTKKHKKTQ